MEGILKKVDSKDAEGWSVKLDGREISVVRQHLSMDETEKNSTILSAARLLGNCSNPCGIPQHRVGIAIGKVQSGKTSNYIALTALAFDNDYDIVIIFGGNTNVLLDQTYKRVLNNFDIEKRADERILTVLTTSNNFNNYSANEIENLHLGGRKIIITALKSYSHIKKIIDMLKKANLSNKPILIIDDEGDQASLNGAVMHDKKTTTYREFVNLFNELVFSTFISVTATPHANLLISVTDDLSPDFCELISPGKLYSGASTFHYAKKTEYISIIPENENILLDVNDGVPFSLEKALSTFFVGGVIRKLRGDNSNHSMLIHPSSRVLDHREVASKVNSVLNSYRESCKSKEEEIFNRFKEFISYGYEELLSTVKEQFKFDDIVEILKKDFFDCKVQVLNGQNDMAVSSYDDFKYVIVIGGTMVERGLTIKNLAVTYLVRTNKGKENADTVLQRSRWFGYRISKGISYLDVCRVFMTECIAENFYNLKLNEDSVWENLRFGQNNGIKLKDLVRVFELDKHFNPTRTNVASCNVFKFGKWASQKSIKGMEKSMVVNTAIKDFLEGYNGEIVSYPTFDCKLYKDVDFEKLFKEIIIPYYSNPSLRFDINYMRAAMYMLKINNQELVLDVMIMRVGQNEKRKIFEDMTVDNLLQGQNGVASEDNYYPGDSKIHNNRIQLQIHNIKDPDDSNLTIPVIAFFAPENTKRLVGGNNDR